MMWPSCLPPLGSPSPTFRGYIVNIKPWLILGAPTLSSSLFEAFVNSRCTDYYSATFSHETPLLRRKTLCRYKVTPFSFERTSMRSSQTYIRPIRLFCMCNVVDLYCFIRPFSRI